MGTTLRKLRIAAYHRVSTLDQDPTLARNELHDAARRLGGEVVLDIEETGSGARNDRPGLQRLMEAARRGKLDAVLVWKLDRFGRSALDVLANIRDLDAAGVRFVATTQGIDIRPGGDAMGRLMLTMLAAVAEFERELIRERTRLGMEKARASGKHIGRPRVVGPAPSEVQRLRAAGRSWRQVAAELRCSTWAARQAAAC
ncbi:MAG TPA: recombinase family protein [Anaeromyxobacteraceae bacterium]|nr:recombinase family protein [Anaeromyxobacteraceae bacterium]